MNYRNPAEAGFFLNRKLIQHTDIIEALLAQEIRAFDAPNISRADECESAVSR